MYNKTYKLKPTMTKGYTNRIDIYYIYIYIILQSGHAHALLLLLLRQLLEHTLMALTRLWCMAMVTGSISADR